MDDLGRHIVSFIRDGESLHKVSMLSHFYRSLAIFHYPNIVRSRASVDFEFRQVWGEGKRGEEEGEVVDSQRGLKAVLMGGASLGTEGLRLKGEERDEDGRVVVEGAYCSCEPWKMGGTFSIEAYVKFNSFKRYSRVFDFGNGLDSENILLYNNATEGEIRWSDYRGSAPRSLQANNTFDSGGWTHIVVTVSDTNTNIFKNGELVGYSKNYEKTGPRLCTRKKHLIGASYTGIPFEGNGEIDCFFDGHIGYIRHYDFELCPKDISALHSVSGRVKVGVKKNLEVPTYDELVRDVVGLKEELSVLRAKLKEGESGNSVSR
ncbi:hypothetical protein TL16_g08549 [Triparma laevis f. inornata]|uniref:Uncharacterized protein n=1 Tax=Triparma laevis f. inornata TaxID=1714386 RepID=A0A9W7AY51_9STRA|nr:hypothetical protein TL16_g08549 [Triparma laevis f. inornata]